MSYGNQNPFQNTNHSQQYDAPVQHNGFVNPQQLVKSNVSTYPSQSQQNYYPNAQGFSTSNSVNQHNGAPQSLYPPPQQQMSAVLIPSLQQPSSSQHYAPSPAGPVSYPSASPTLHTGAQNQDAFINQRQPPEQAEPSQPEFAVDFPLLLHSMADEYFSAAYSLGAGADILGQEANMQEYYKLITTGIACLEALLKNYRLAPDLEASVRLRYATILYEETENTMEAEEALSKGISLCERHRFDDMKYNMQHILIRLMFQKNSRAAFKYLERCVADAQAYQHSAWIYGFRFLKVSLHLKLNSRHDLHAALSQLRMVSDIAKEQGDKSILATATTMEALVALKDRSDLEGFEQAQRALASVRSLQLDPKIGENPQLKVLTSFADVSCHLQRLQPDQALSSMLTMQQVLDSAIKNDRWKSGKIFTIPLENATMPSINQNIGVLRKQSDGSTALILSWMPKDDIYDVGYLLSAIAMAHKNIVDGRKSEKLLVEGIRQESHAQRLSDKIPKSITRSIEEQMWREQRTYYNRIHLAFILTARGAWNGAKEQTSYLKSLHNSWPDVPDNLFLLNQYLRGIIAQGTGDLSAAISLYDSVIKTSNASEVQPSQTPPQSRHLPVLGQDLFILSMLNKLLIIRNPSHPLNAQYSSLLSGLNSLCINNPNRSLTCAYHLLSSIPPNPTNSTILSTKSSLQSALQSAKATANNQLMCIVLNIMSWKFFSGVVGEQAEKSARASHSLAKKGGDTLWICVAAGALAKTLEAAGKVEEAEKVLLAGREGMKDLPGKVREYAETN